MGFFRDIAEQIEDGLAEQFNIVTPGKLRRELDVAKKREQAERLLGARPLWGLSVRRGRYDDGDGSIGFDHDDGPTSLAPSEFPGRNRNLAPAKSIGTSTAGAVVRAVVGPIQTDPVAHLDLATCGCDPSVETISLDRENPIVIGVYIEDELGSELWKLSQVVGTDELVAQIKSIVSESFGEDLECDVSFHCGSFFARIVLMAKRSVAAMVSVVSYVATKVKEAVVAFCAKVAIAAHWAAAKIRTISAKVNWKQVGNVVLKTANVLSIISMLFGSGGWWS